MKRSVILIAAVCALFAGAGVVTAQAFLQPVLLQDITANGTALRYFGRAPSVHKWAFTGIPVSVPAISGSTMTLAAPVQTGVAIATPSATCSSGVRGEFYTIQQPNNGVDGGSGGNSDGGRADLTFQCCKGTGGTYSWVAVGCQ